MAKVTPVIRRLRDLEEVSRVAAERFVEIARRAISARGRFTVALSGGSTPRRLFERLADPPFRQAVDWTRVEFFWSDERPFPPEHPDSNYRMAREALLAKLDIPEPNVHRMPADREDREAAALDYQAEIARTFGVPVEGEPPRFDLILLGMGTDGHTASLFPYSEALKEMRRWVVFHYVADLRAYRMTLTPIVLSRAACVMFLVTGPDKAERLAEVLEGPEDVERLPSQIVQPGEGELVWLVDRGAAHRLRSGPGEIPQKG